MPDPANIAAIYDLEQALEKAIAAVYESNQIAAYTSQTAPELQKKRPRVEIVATIGAGQGQFITHPQYRGVECETAWAVAFTIRAITAAGVEVHNAFRTQARYLAHTLRGVINDGAYMKNHYLNSCMDSGTSPTYEPQQGDYQTDLTFTGGLSVQRNAWQLLTQ